MRLRLTLCLIGSPVSWLAKSRISSTERKSSLACALVMRVCDSGCSADGDGVLPCCWFCTATPAPGTCVVPWFGDCAGRFDCGWLGMVWAHRSEERRVGEECR